MRTLDYWKSRLTEVPFTIECPEMRLLGRDHEAPVFVGAGHIDVKNSTEIDFTMFASAGDGMDAFRRVLLARENPSEVMRQFRLVATDEEGTRWNCGWTQPEFKMPTKIGWFLTGRVSSLLTIASGPTVSADPGVELVFQPGLRIPMTKWMTSISSVDGEEVGRRRRPAQHALTILGSEIRFFYTPADDWLWATAKTSEKLPHPHAENWLSEPLRVLLGQLVFPRLVARNFGNGKAQVWLRRSPRRFKNYWSACLIEEDPLFDRRKFWELYASYLTLIAESRDERGNRNFEANPITRFYEEIIQATRGSRWVQCLTLASTGEAITRMLMGPGEQKPEFPPEEVESLKKIVKAWKGDGNLRDRTLRDIARAGQTSMGKYLRSLVNSNVLTEGNIDAWSEVRNKVMHGNLVSNWPTKEEDKRILALGNLVHRLTRELIRTQTT
jgi:hypothetical protein